MTAARLCPTSRAEAAIGFLCVATVLLCWFAQPAAAHHSYADFDLDQTRELRGTLTAIHWANPHILLTVNDGTRDVSIEWITLTGAEKTATAREQFTVGDAVVVVASPHRNPANPAMTVVKELRLPDKDWQWPPPGYGPRSAAPR